MDVQDALSELFDAPSAVYSAQLQAPPPPPKQQKAQAKPPAKPPQGPAQAKRTGPPTRRRNAKRARGNTGAAQPSAPGYDKQSIPGARMMYQRRRIYQILCANTGVNELCDVLFHSIQFRDFRMAANVSVEQLKYCVVIASWARSASVAVDAGYISADVPDISRLLKAVVGLQLPSVLAKYIETMGLIRLASGVEIGPWFALRATMANRHFNQVNPDTLLLAAGRLVPANYWSIDREWIADWNQATTRPARLGMRFRPIAWSITSGMPEMVITPLVSADEEEYLRPSAPQQFSDVEGQLGAVYRWRSFTGLRHWPEQTSLVCTKLFYGTELYPREFWSDVVVASFVTVEKQ